MKLPAPNVSCVMKCGHSMSPKCACEYSPMIRNHFRKSRKILRISTFRRFDEVRNPLTWRVIGMPLHTANVSSKMRLIRKRSFKCVCEWSLMLTNHFRKSPKSREFWPKISTFSTFVLLRNRKVKTDKASRPRTGDLNSAFESSHLWLNVLWMVWPGDDFKCGFKTSEGRKKQ